jgi:3-oxoacyl-[acyl-carrier protein] reductase
MSVRESRSKERDWVENVRLGVARLLRVSNAVQKALDQFRRVEILVNDAGFLRDRMLHNMSEEEWDSVLDIHLKGTFVCTLAVAPTYREQRVGTRQ